MITVNVVTEPSVLHATVAGGGAGLAQVPVTGVKSILPTGPAWAISTAAPPAGACAESWMVRLPLTPGLRLRVAGVSWMPSEPTVTCEVSVEPPRVTSSEPTTPTVPPVSARTMNVSHTCVAGMVTVSVSAKVTPSFE